jgi:amidase
MADPFALLDATAQAELVRREEVQPLELVEAAIARIERLDGSLGAVIARRFERAREEARSPALPRGPFRGVPFLLKDLGAHLAGDPVHSGMLALKRCGWREAGETHFAGKLRRAGLVSLGRTNTPELGLLPATEPAAQGATRNPWSLAHSPGGSSGGSAAAVAAGLVPAAHGSDGGGSIRIPASHCGLVGMKPTRGRCSFGPALGERWAGFSAEGFLARTVRDAAALLDLVAGPMPGDPYAAPPPARPFRAEVGADPGCLRIGFMTAAPRAGELHPDCRAAAESAVRLLSRLGHALEPAHPEALDEPDALAGFLAVVSSATALALEQAGEKVGRPLAEGDVEPLTWSVAELGRQLKAPQYLAALQRNHAWSRRIAAFWGEGGFDLLLTPTCAAPPPELGHFAVEPGKALQAYARAVPWSTFTSPFNVTGQPAVSLPLHWSPAGLPIGVQLVAASGREDLLFRVAGQLEAEEPWAGRLPPVHAAHARAYST